MLRNRGWDRPQDWGVMNANERIRWHEIADNLEQFYRDMRTHRHINVGLSRFMTPDVMFVLMLGIKYQFNIY